jgi:hypothetical protein
MGEELIGQVQPVKTKITLLGDSALLEWLTAPREAV